MENVHILTQRIAGRGDFLPFSAEQANTNGNNRTLELAAKLQTSLVIEDILDIFSQFAKQLLNFSGVHFQATHIDVKTPNSDQKHPPHTFNLSIEDERLGTLTYYTKYPLSVAIEEKLKQFHSVLVYPLRNAIMYNRVLRLATKDSLTGLNNRSQFNDMLLQKLENFRRNEHSFSLMLLDLDNFKQVNDTYGHKVGDDVLKEFAAVLASSVRGTDSVFRFGGDEFSILIADPSFNTNKVVSARIMRLVRNAPLMSKYEVTASIGFTLTDNSDCQNEIFTRADKALYKAKAAGRNCAKAY